MELYLFRHAEWERFYNCSAPDVAVDRVPMAQRRTFVVEPWVNAVLCLVFYLIYMPCMVSIWRHRNDNACYKLLLYIGITDFMILWLLGFVHSWLSMQGAVFCSHPNIIYWHGLGVCSLWIAESCADLVLAVNRCIEILWPNAAEILFKGHRIWIWLGVCTVHALWWLIFETPALFSAIQFGYFFNPFVGYREDPEGMYLHDLYPIHAWTISIGTPLAYVLFAIALFFQSRAWGAPAMNRLQNMCFLQVFMISVMNFLAAGIYQVMAYLFYRPWMITVAHFAWIHIHGFPPVIYLLLNKTIRQDCQRMLRDFLLLLGARNGGRVTPGAGMTIGGGGGGTQVNTISGSAGQPRTQQGQQF